MKKLVSFVALVLVAPSVSAQVGLAHRALGSAAQMRGMQIAGRIILIPRAGPDVQVELDGAVLQASSASSAAASASVREVGGKRLVDPESPAQGAMAELGGFVAYEEDTTPASKVANIGGFAAYEDGASNSGDGTFVAQGGFVAHGSSSAVTLRKIDGKKLADEGFRARGTMAELGGFVAYEEDTTPASTLGHVGGFVAYEDDTSPAGKVAHIGGFVAYEDDTRPAETVGSLGGFVAYGSSAASSSVTLREIDLRKLPKDRGFSPRGKMTALGGFVPYVDPRTDPLVGTFANIDGASAHGSSPASASQAKRDIDPIEKDRRFTPRGKMSALGGLVAYEEDDGGAKSLGRTREIGGAIARGESDDDPNARGKFGHVAVGPVQVGQEGEIEPNPVEVTQVTLFGRSGSSYALMLQPMGSANGPQILIAHGMLFGTDPDEGLRKLVLRLPVELGVLLIPLE